jgi:hypothetical protein
LQCWKLCLWLATWFDQQAAQCQQHLHLRSLCCGASA